MPLSACVGPAHVMEAWPPSDGEAVHTSTFLGNPLACAAGLAVLGEVGRKRLVERSRRLGADLLERLREALGAVREVAEVRGRGLFVGIELAQPGGRVPLAGGAVRVAERALAEGILILPAGSEGQVLELSPPLVISEEQVAWVVPRLTELIRRGAAL